MIWPTASEEGLLRSALSASRGALTPVDVARLDERARRLLPLLHPRLDALGAERSLRDAVEHEYRSAASRNAALFERGATLLRCLAAAGVDTMLLKGAALVTGYYRDPGLRSMVDLDLLVRPRSLLAALAALQRAGWAPSLLFTSAVLSARHAVAFTTPPGLLCDLHWRMFPEADPPGTSEEPWVASVEVDFLGARTRILSPADQLLHACVHGVTPGPEPSPWWVGDAAAVVRAGPVDWDRLVSRAIAHRFVLRVREALRYLRERFAMTIPADVTDRLARADVCALEKLEWRVMSGERAMPRALLRHWCLHRRSAGGGLAGVSGFLGYLRGAWGLKSARDLPRAVAARVLASVRRTVPPAGH